MNSNIVIEVNREILRVEKLLDKMDQATRDKASRSIRFARLSLSQSDLAGMYESFDELREFEDPRPGRAAA